MTATEWLVGSGGELLLVATGALGLTALATGLTRCPVKRVRIAELGLGASALAVLLVSTMRWPEATAGRSSVSPLIWL